MLPTLFIKLKTSCTNEVGGGPPGRLRIESTTDFVVVCCMSLVNRLILLLLIVVEMGDSESRL